MVGIDQTVDEIRLAAETAVDRLLGCEAITAQEKLELRQAIQRDLVRIRDNLRDITSQLANIDAVRQKSRQHLNRFPGLGAVD